MIINVPQIKKVKVKLLSHVQLFATPWTVAHQSPLSMEFSRQEYSSRLPFPTPGNLPNSTLAGEFFTTKPPGKSTRYFRGVYNKKLLIIYLTD